MPNNLTIRNRLTLGFAGIVVLILILLTLAYHNSVRLAQANDWNKHTLAVMLETERMSNDILAIQTITRTYLLTGESSHLAPLSGLEKALRTHIANATTLTKDDAGRQSRFKKIAALADTWIGNHVHALIEQRRSIGKTIGAKDYAQLAVELNQAIVLTADIARLGKAAIADEEQLLVERSHASSEWQDAMLLVLTVGGAICVALALAISYWLTKAMLTPLKHLTDAVTRIGMGDQTARAQVISGDELGQVTTEFNRMAQSIQDNLTQEIAATALLRSQVDHLLGVVSQAAAGNLTKEVSVTGGDAIGQLGNGLSSMLSHLRVLIENVQRAGIQVSTSATEIAAAAKQQEATGIEHAQTSVEVLSTTQEISGNTRLLLKTMEDATTVADFTTKATAEAQESLHHMDATMQQMVSATDSISSKLAALSEKASNINSILITIIKVADQTNLLSLNAAIEAEKAGDAGRGFSVVATEIRRLADQTSTSTWDIEQMLKEMQSAVSASVMGMDKFSEEIRRSVSEVRKVTDQLSEVMGQVQRLMPQFDTVLQGMQSQAVGAAQISETMSRLNYASQQSVESLKATSEAVLQLQYAATDLQTSTANFTVTTD
ncbi:methyl-accepting chemotaxis protein [Massilia sp. BJB1822]|uniref:methyl-accepting chemotaxis protein n=1 Tax=Massilia sp. BJB1822 TaxID=2744470 RepID=UPI00159411E7|nr:methyl-accepting chemotaxis protein [Massilia sp. BJB1822]NVD97663.1 CHASE3 domain-containing protein [Massilia sp. BJB1822]